MTSGGADGPDCRGGSGGRHPPARARRRPGRQRKTTALAPAVEALRAQSRAVFGAAPSAAAAEVLSADAGLDADTLDKLLAEHRLERPPDHRYDLPAGATVLVDQAAMVSTPDLVELAALADRQGWRLALVGDPLQFSAVGRSGMFGYLVAAYGAIELEGVRRFAADWEREASYASAAATPMSSPSTTRTAASTAAGAGTWSGR